MNSSNSIARNMGIFSQETKRSMIYSDRSRVILFFILFFLFFPLRAKVSFHSSGKNPLICDVDLADWGFDDPEDIGYLSMGILHKRGGDEIVVYDVRAKKPVIEQPPRPLSRIPPIREDIFLLDDFHRGNTNRLGGYFSSIVREPSISHVTIDRASDGRQSLCFTYDRKSQGFAGFWIHLFDFKKPPVERVFLDVTPFRYLTFEIKGELGGERLSLQVADYSWERKEDSIEIGDVDQFLPAGKIQKSWQRAWVPLEKIPESITRTELASLVFLAHPGKGRVFIGDVAFTTEKDVHLPEPEAKKAYSPSPHKAMWLWNTKDLLGRGDEQNRLTEFCKLLGITEIFLQLPYGVEEKNGKKEIFWNTSGVASLLSFLHSKGIKVHALDGDPRFVLREKHRHVLATIESIIQFNRSVPPNERFDGVRYDNEPYLLSTFAGVQKKSIIEQYMVLLRLSKDLAASSGLEFGVDIPFWFDEKNEFFEPITTIQDRPLTESILDIVDNIGIMDYRTEAYGADGIIAHALGELRYASERGKKVFIGLETSEVPDETIMEFGRGPGPSQILLEKREGTKILLRWFRDGASAKTGSDALLFQQKKTFVPSGKLSFYKKNTAELDEVMKEAKSEFQNYPAFYGFALHYYESYRLLEQKMKKD